jgi:hypothetical protein
MAVRTSGADEALSYRLLHHFNPLNSAYLLSSSSQGAQFVVVRIKETVLRDRPLVNERILNITVCHMDF